MFWTITFSVRLALASKCVSVQNCFSLFWNLRIYENFSTIQRKKSSPKTNSKMIFILSVFGFYLYSCSPFSLHLVGAFLQYVYIRFIFKSQYYGLFISWAKKGILRIKIQVSLMWVKQAKTVYFHKEAKEETVKNLYSYRHDYIRLGNPCYVVVLHVSICSIFFIFFFFFLLS